MARSTQTYLDKEGRGGDVALPVHARSDLASNLPLEEDRGSGQAGAKSCHRQGHGD